MMSPTDLPSRLKPWETSLFSALAFLYLALLSLENIPAEALVKSAPILALFYFSRRYFQGRQGQLISLALLFSASGDVLLTLSNSWSFPAGLASFLVAQLIYASLFFRGHIQRHELSSRHVIIAVLLLCHALFFANLLLPVAGELAIAILAYLCAISLMGFAAVFYAHSIRVLVGAISFIASDTLIAVNKFLIPFDQADHAIMASYYLAQLLIFQGLLASVKTNDPQ